MGRSLFALVLGSMAFSTVAQENSAVDLKWKIGADETLSYLTIMNEIDTGTMDLDFGGILASIPDSSSGRADVVKDLFKKLNDSFKEIDLQTDLTNNGNGIVEIVMRTIPSPAIATEPEDTLHDIAADMMKLMRTMNGGVLLRGSVHETGGIHSFWIKSNQKNLIALFFELPTGPVRIGDVWELDVQFIANDQNFRCDTSYKKNMVSVTDVKQLAGETIAVLTYDIVEYVSGDFSTPSFSGASAGATKTMMKFTHQAIAEFSIDRGRWLSYDGIMGIESTGMMSSKIRKKFSLIEKG